MPVMAAPKNPNNTNAVAARKRKAQERKALELQRDGWLVVPPQDRVGWFHRLGHDEGMRSLP